MPLYDFVVLDERGNPTSEVFEEFTSRDTHELVDQYGRRAIRRGVQMIAHIPTRWGESHGYYDRDLRQMVYSQRDIDRACEAKGWVPVGDMPSHCIESTADKVMREAAHFEKVESQWQAAFKKHGYDPTSPNPDISAYNRAQNEVMPVQSILNGTCDAIKPIEEI